MTGSRTYRVIELRIESQVGWGVPVGALLSAAGEPAEIVLSDVVPGAACLGGPRRSALLRAIRRRLARKGAADIPWLPNALGPQVQIGEPQLVPRRVEDAGAWLRQTLGKEPRVERKSRSETNAPKQKWSSDIRSHHGFRFLRTHGVDDLVENTFQPAHDRVGLVSSHLPQLSQWVDGQEHVLLMEPLAPRREKFLQDITTVRTRLAAYQWDLKDRPDSAVLIAYVLRGGEERLRREALEATAEVAEVFDVADSAQRTRLIETIRRTRYGDAHL